MESRNKFIAKNIAFGYASNIIGLLLNFASRTIFIYTLGNTYLGISGLFGNILGLLSFAELGIGTAMNFALYKPVAEKNIEKIKSYMKLYQTAYRIIAAVVAVVGLLICPFLKYIVNDGGVLKGNELYIYYLIYLFNTVTSYFVSYKFSLVNAEQKNYIFTTINTITNIATIAFQIIVLLVFKNFLLYLLTASVVSTIQKIIVSVYLKKMYPYLSDKNTEKLSKDEIGSIKKNVKALIVHKIGEISVYQTDNIIISMFQGIQTVGLVSNYNLIITSVKGFVTIIFDSATSSFGNLIVKSETDHQYELFRCYKFLGFWIYGFCSIAFATLMSPFITLWIGSDSTIDYFTVFLLCADFYLVGQRATLNNVKVAGGVFRQDRFVAFLQAIVNIIVSVVMIKLIGLPGVYVGTIVQGLISTVIKPIIVYKNLFHIKPYLYFKQGMGHLLTTLISGLICQIICNKFLSEVTIITFIFRILIVIIVPNLIFLILYFRTKEFKYLLNVINIVLKRKKNE